MFRVFQLLISDTIMSIDHLLFFIACLLQVSLSLYFMTLKTSEGYSVFLTPASLSIKLSSFGNDWSDYFFTVISMLGILNQSTSLMTCVLFNEWHLEAHTVVSRERVSVFIIWSRYCSVSALSSYCSFCCSWWPVSRETAKTMKISCSLWKLTPRWIISWFLLKPIFIMIVIKW